MKKPLAFLFLLFAAGLVYSQSFKSIAAVPDSSKPILIAKASCGQCQFGMPGNGCSLAVRIDSKSYFVDGDDIDAHQDAHAQDGFCEAIRKAEVQGDIIYNRFKISYFRLVDETENNATKK
jgi:hypothetical protein